MSKKIENKLHYPYVTRSLIRLFNDGLLSNIADVIVEPKYGYTTQIKYNNGTSRITYGNDLGLNSGAACDLAKDKGFSKFILRSMGINCPKGEEFLMPWWAETIGKSQEKRGNTDINTHDKASAYIRDHLSYPVYIKPINGSKGGDVYKINSDTELNDIISMYDEKRVRLAVIEETINMPDYRIVILDGKLISAYQRIPLSVKGNGADNITELLAKLQIQYDSEGRDTILNANDPRISKHLDGQGLSLNYIPALGENIILMPISNLSVGGTSVDVTNTIAPRWIDLAARIAKGFNLHLCGVDLACNDITAENSEYCVIEVNAAPGLDHYASSGEKQKKTVDELYIQVLNIPQKI